MRVLVFLVVMAAAGEAWAANCHRGCACGNTCISCSNTCHSGGGGGSVEPDPSSSGSNNDGEILGWTLGIGGGLCLLTTGSLAAVGVALANPQWFGSGPPRAAGPTGGGAPSTFRGQRTKELEGAPVDGTGGPLLDWSSLEELDRLPDDSIHAFEACWPWIAAGSSIDRGGRLASGRALVDGYVHAESKGPWLRLAGCNDPRALAPLEGGGSPGTKSRVAEGPEVFEGRMRQAAAAAREEAGPALLDDIALARLRDGVWYNQRRAFQACFDDIGAEQHGGRMERLAAGAHLVEEYVVIEGSDKAAWLRRQGCTDDAAVQLLWGF